MITNFQIIVGLVVALVLGLLAIFIAMREKKHSARYIIDLALKPYLREKIQDIIIPDGVGGLVDVSSLLLIEQGILIMEELPISGNIYGADNIEQWTQLHNGRSYKFPNPLHRMNTLRQAVQVLAPKTSIFCRVIFTAQDSAFPKGKPEQVSNIFTLETDLVALTSQAKMTQSLYAEWERILRIARKDGQAVMRS